MVHMMVVFEEGWSFIRGRKQCKPKHVSSGVVVLNVRWSLIRVVPQEGDYCSRLLGYRVLPRKNPQSGTRFDKVCHIAELEGIMLEGIYGNYYYRGNKFILC